LTANTNATVRFSSGTVSKVQLEPGTVATPFEYRPISTENALCRYYFRVINVLGIAASANLAFSAGNTLYCTYPLSETMRATPTASSTATWTVQNVPSPTVTPYTDKILLSAISTAGGNCLFVGVSGQIQLAAEL
jgi:hypothetical protein